MRRKLRWNALNAEVLGPFHAWPAKEREKTRRSLFSTNRVRFVMERKRSRVPPARVQVSFHSPTARDKRQKALPEVGHCTHSFWIGYLSRLRCLYRTDRHASISTCSALSRPVAHWGSQFQVGAAIFLSASKAREKARSHRETRYRFQIPPEFACPSVNTA